MSSGAAADEFTRGCRAWMLFMLMPTLVGIISDLAARHSFGGGNFPSQCPGGTGRPGADAALTSACGAASAYGIRFAMAAVVFLLLWGSLHYFLAARTLRADLDVRYQATKAVT